MKQGIQWEKLCLWINNQIVPFLDVSSCGDDLPGGVDVSLLSYVHHCGPAHRYHSTWSTTYNTPQ